MSNLENSRSVEFGTAGTAKVFLAMMLLATPDTLSQIPDVLEQPIKERPALRTTTLVLPQQEQIPLEISNTITASSGRSLINRINVNEAERLTTTREKIIGEIRRWALLGNNWDGEGSELPVAASLKEAVAFVRLLGEYSSLPEPMLLSSGYAGLFWKNDKLYADLEFLSDGRVAYFIEHNGEGKHKGVLKFDSQKIPPVFLALLDI